MRRVDQEPFVSPETRQHLSDAAVVFGDWIENKAGQAEIDTDPTVITKNGFSYLRVIVLGKSVVPSVEELLAGVPNKDGWQELFIKLPNWIQDTSHPYVCLLVELGAALNPPVVFDTSTEETAAESLGKLLVRDAPVRSKIGIVLLEQIHTPGAVDYLQQNATSPNQGLEKGFFEFPDQKVSFNGGDFDTNERIALLVAALLEPDHSGPVSRFVRFLYANDFPTSIKQSSNGKDYILFLLHKAIKLNQELRETDRKTKQAEAKGEMPDFKEIGLRRSVSRVPAELVIKAVSKHDTKADDFNNETNAAFTKLRQTILFQRFEVDTTRQPNEHLEQDTQQAQQLQANKRQTELFIEELAVFRQSQGLPELDNSWQILVTALCRFHIDSIKHSQVVASLASLDNLLNKPLTALTHEQIALILALEVVILSTPANTLQIDLNETPAILELAEKLHEHGLYFFNAIFPSSHPAQVLHGAIINGQFDPCPIHTVPQLQALQLSVNSVAASPSISMAAPSFSVAFPAVPTMVTGGFAQSASGLMQGIGLGLGAVAVGSAGLISGLRSGEGGVGRSDRTEKARTFQSKPASKKTTKRNSSPGTETSSLPPLLFFTGGSSQKPRQVGQKKTVAPESGNETQKPKLKDESNPEKPVASKKKYKANNRLKKVVSLQGEVNKKPAPVVKPVKEKAPSPHIVAVIKPPATGSTKEKATKTLKPPRRRKKIIGRSPKTTKLKKSDGEPPKQITRQLGGDTNTRKVRSKNKNQTVKAEQSAKTSVNTQEKTKRTKTVIVNKTSQKKITNEKPTTVATENKIKKATQQNRSVYSEQAVTNNAVVSTNRPKATTTEIPLTAAEIKDKPAATTSKKTLTSAESAQEKPITARTSQADVESTTSSQPAEQSVADQATVSDAVTIAASVVVAPLLGVRRVIQMLSQLQTPATFEATQETTQNTLEEETEEDTGQDAVQARMLRKRSEVNPGRGGTAKQQSVFIADDQSPVTDTVPTNQAAKTIVATARSLPTDAVLDLSDAFNNAREVRMWAQEAVANRKLIDQYYDTIAA